METWQSVLWLEWKVTKGGRRPRACHGIDRVSTNKSFPLPVLGVTCTSMYFHASLEMLLSCPSQMWPLSSLTQMLCSFRRLGLASAWEHSLVYLSWSFFLISTQSLLCFKAWPLSTSLSESWLHAPKTNDMENTVTHLFLEGWYEFFINQVMNLDTQGGFRLKHWSVFTAIIWSKLRIIGNGPFLFTSNDHTASTQSLSKSPINMVWWKKDGWNLDDTPSHH